jgi:glycosyltransferase involved in cell wall biosynthesis
MKEECNRNVSRSSRKVLFFIDSLQRGGAETLLLTICQGIRERFTEEEMRLSVLLYRGVHDLTEEFNRLHIPVVALDLAHYPFLLRFYHAYKAIKKIGPDIIHSHLLYSDSYSLVAAFFAGVKIRYSTTHNMEPMRLFKKTVTRLLTSLFATQIITVSDSVKSFFAQKKIYAVKKMKTIYNGTNFNPEQYAPKKHMMMHTPVKLITVGRIVEQKAHAKMIDVLQVLKKISSVPFELHFYGTGELEATLKAKIQKYCLTNVFLHGLIDNRLIPEVLQACDMFIAFSLWEGFNISVVEAMCVGLPVVLSDIPPHRELVASACSTYEFLVACNDENALAEKIVLLTSSAETYDAAAMFCHEQSKNFTQEKMVAQYCALYA